MTIYCVILYSNSPLYLCKQTLVSFGKSPSLAHTVLERHGNEDALPATSSSVHQKHTPRRGPHGMSQAISFSLPESESRVGNLCRADKWQFSAETTHSFLVA